MKKIKKVLDTVSEAIDDTNDLSSDDMNTIRNNPKIALFVRIFIGITAPIMMLIFSSIATAVASGTASTIVTVLFLVWLLALSYSTTKTTTVIRRISRLIDAGVDLTSSTLSKKANAYALAVEYGLIPSHHYPESLQHFGTKFMLIGVSVVRPLILLSAGFSIITTGSTMIIGIILILMGLAFAANWYYIVMKCPIYKLIDTE